MPDCLRSLWVGSGRRDARPGAAAGVRVKNWRVTFFVGVLIASLVGLANGSVGSSVWGLLAGIALVGEVLESRKGGSGSMTAAFLFGIVLSLALVAVAVGLVVGAVLAPSEEQRKPYIGMAILVTPMATLVCWVTLAGYRKVRRLQLDTSPQRPASEAYAELVATARKRQAQMAPDPHREKRQRRLQLFLGVSAAGWALGRIAERVDENTDSAMAGLLLTFSTLLMFGGLLAAGWTTVWVFKGRSGEDR